MPRRILEGKVVSDKMNKSVTVLVTRQFMHPLYKKFVRKTKKYVAHDESNKIKQGDIVQIQECQPISKRKSWTVITASDTRADFQAEKKSSGGVDTGKKTKTVKKKTEAKTEKKKADKKKTTSKKKDDQK